MKKGEKVMAKEKVKYKQDIKLGNMSEQERD